MDLSISISTQIFRFQAWSSGLFLHRYLALLALLKCMCMHRYNRTCRPHPLLQDSCMIELRAMFSLCLNVYTLVSYYLSRYDRKHLAFARSLQVQWRHSRSTRTSILIVPDSQLNSYDIELLPRLSLRERLNGLACKCDGGILALLKRICDTGTRDRLMACAQCPAGPARKNQALCALWMHLHDKLCLLHIALLFWPIRCIMTQTDTFWKIFFIYSNITNTQIQCPLWFYEIVLSSSDWLIKRQEIR